jgi:hypothetical protein
MHRVQKRCAAATCTDKRLKAPKRLREHKIAFSFSPLLIIFDWFHIISRNVSKSYGYKENPLSAGRKGERRKKGCTNAPLAPIA